MRLTFFPGRFRWHHAFILAACAVSGVILSRPGEADDSRKGDAAAAKEISGSILIDTGRVLKPVPKRLYGIQATWVYEAQGMWDARASRVKPEIQHLARELTPGPVRFPEGISADYYDWRDGIGPQNARPTRPHGSDKDKSGNGFGTDELIEFCRTIGAEPHLVVNILKGTPESAAGWVDYCNRPNQAERARNGARDPYDVRLWEIGNEPYIQAWSPAQKEGQRSAKDYAQLFLRYAAAMRRVDPRIRLMAVGGNNFGSYNLTTDNNWNRTLLETASSEIDYLAVHNAYTPVMIKKGSFEEVYQAMLTFPEHVRRDLKSLNQQIEQYATRDAGRIRLAITEWGPFFAPRQDEAYLDHSKTLGSALSVAAMMQVLLTADRLEIANFFKFIDIAFQGMVSHDGVPKPSYYAMQMFTKHFGDLLVGSETRSPTYDLPKAIGAVDPLKQLPYLTAVASLSEDRSRAYVIALNKNFHSSIRTTVSLRGFKPMRQAAVWTLTAPSLDANNGEDLPRNVGIKWPKPARAPVGSLFDQGKPGAVSTQRTNFEGAADRFEIIIPSKAVVAIELKRE